MAVELTKDKQLWQSPLRALGNIRHSQYLNRMTLDASYDDVRVYGNETLLGRPPRVCFQQTRRDAGNDQHRHHG